MATADVIRKTQRAIGDSNEILITKADIVDAINEAQLYIARETGYRTTSTTDTGTNFRTGKTITDLIQLQRVYYNGSPLSLLDKETVDRMDLSQLPDGTPVAYYMLGRAIYLFPNPESEDSTTVTVWYVDTPTALADENSTLDVPAIYEDDVTNFCRMRAHERNENYRAAEYYERQFKEGVAQRKYEGQSNDDSFYTVSPDYMDQDWYYDSI